MLAGRVGGNGTVLSEIIEVSSQSASMDVPPPPIEMKCESAVPLPEAPREPPVEEATDAVHAPCAVAKADVVHEPRPDSVPETTR